MRSWTPAFSSKFLVRTLCATTALASVTASAQRGDAFDTKLRPPAEERTLLKVPPGFEVQFVAAEPDIQKPMNIAFDYAGRVWVTGSSLYPWPARRDALGEPIASFQKNWDDNNLAFRAASTPPEPADEATDSVRILSDFDREGRARKVTVFADQLNIPIGVLPLPREPGAKGDTALVFSIPAIWRLTDTDGDGRADRREKLYDGFGFKDTHGMSSSYWQWFDGWVYGTHGFANASEVTDRSGNVVKFTSGNTYRFRPDGSRFELFARGQTNPFGLAFDSRGDLYTADSHSKPVYLLVPGGYYEGINREHDGLGFAPAITTDDHGSSAIAGIAHYSAAHFPREFHDNLFNGNPVTRRINRVRLDWRGSSPHAARQTDFLTSDDPAFRPVQVKLGPDGALWVADFYNPIIGHYEVPLTHPSRDNAHGRIWRIVWRGLDYSLPSPSLPSFAGADVNALANKLADSNLVVRTLASAELAVRRDAANAASALKAIATRLIAGNDPTADETAALAALMTLERIGQADDALLARAMARPDSMSAIAALRVLAARETLPANTEEMLTQIVGRAGPLSPPQTATEPVSPLQLNAGQSAPPNPAAPGHAWRVVAEILTRHPQPWAAPLLLSMQPRVPEADVELAYALRLALKAQALTASESTLREWGAANAATADRVADVCLAVPTRAAADFLLGYLERTKFAGIRAGDFARHAILQLPDDQMNAVLPLLRSLTRGTRLQRIAVAEGLASVAAKPDRTLPPEADGWMRSELIAAVDDKDAALALRAINALKPLEAAEKSEPLRRVALTTTIRESNRIAALRALALNDPAAEETLIAILRSNGSNLLRRTAAELLGTANATPSARVALVEAFPSASADVALALALGLARSDAGASKLIELAASGRARPTLLRHRHVVLAFEKRPAELRARVDALTKSLPAEDARLDALIAQRLSAGAALKVDATRGAAVFTQHCAACHKVRDTGGNLGPSLDGAASRGTPRLVEDILDPSRNIDPAFRLHTLTLKNGETKSALNVREENGRVLFADPATAEQSELTRADVSQISPSPVSAMPAAFDTLLSEQDLFDLLSHLRTPAR